MVCPKCQTACVPHDANWDICPKCDKMQRRVESLAEKAERYRRERDEAVKMLVLLKRKLGELGVLLERSQSSGGDVAKKLGDIMGGLKP